MLTVSSAKSAQLAEPEQYKRVDEESQNFIFTTNSFTHRTPVRSSGDRQEDRIQYLFYNVFCKYM